MEYVFNFLELQTIENRREVLLHFEKKSRVSSSLSVNEILKAMTVEINEN